MDDDLSHMTPEQLAYLAGHGSNTSNARQEGALAGDRIVAAAQHIAHPDRPRTSFDPPERDLVDWAEQGPPGLAYVAGLGRRADLQQREQDKAGDRIVAAAQASDSLFGEITAHAFEDGDRIVFDARGGHEIQYGDEE